MHVTFKNAPLVEIIAELRWLPPYLVPQGGQLEGVPPQVMMPIPMFNANKAEEFYMRFGGVAYQAGFQRSERLVPPGFPVQLGQAIYRYKPAETAPNDLMRSALFQVGPGVFSANAIPPYKSWTEFAPIVARGVEALLNSRDDSEKDLPFSGVSLRYIDAFGPGLRTTRSPGQFIKEVLGFVMTLPGPVAEHAEDIESVTSQHQFIIPVQGGMTMSLAVNEGLFNGEPAVILDTTVSVSGDVGCTVNYVMSALNAAREIIHSMFVGVTKNIQAEMIPVTEA